MSAGEQIRRLASIVAVAACAAAFEGASAQQSPPSPSPAPAKARSTPYKDPELATILGVLIPGAGQLYAERFGKGLGVLGGTAAAAAIAIDASNSKCGVDKSCSHTAIENSAIVAAALVWGYGWATAGRDARLRNNQMLNGTSLAPFLDRRGGRVLAGLSLATR